MKNAQIKTITSRNIANQNYFMMKFIQDNIPLGLLSLAVLLRWLVAQFPYSGYQKPPLYGDYEAQRHWMEITTNLPVEDWYKNTTDNDLLYWGLDYPPLTAYHMYFLGQVSNIYLNSSWVELHKSRGIETYEHKIFMRSSVLLSDMLIYLPAIVYYFYHTQPIEFRSPPSNQHKQNVAIYTALHLMYPAQILVDHGHFQYNCVFMGLVLWAVIFICKQQHVFASITFSLALGYKQMSLYYALPFFWYLAACNIRARPILTMMRKFISIGAVVAATLGLIFLPFIQDLNLMAQVINRIFPFYRGVFEDKVANLWFCINIFYKFRTIFSIPELIRASTLMTILLSLPSGIHLLFKPTLRSFKYSLVNTSLVFFLLSFQVHEKTILVPALPILLLYREHPLAVNWFVAISTYSLQPLMIKDGQLVPYLVLMALHTLLTLELFHKSITLNLAKIFSWHNLTILLYLTSVAGCFTTSFSSIYVKPPKRYPDIHPTVNAVYSCVHYVGFLLFFYYQQFRSVASGPNKVLLIKKMK